MNEKSKRLPLIVRCLRAVLLYPCFLLIWSLCMLTMAGFRTEDQPLLLAAALFMPFIFFSAARVFAEQDKEGNAELAESGAEALWARIRVLLGSHLFWIDAGTVLGLFLILPAAAGFYHVDLVFLSGLSPWGARLMLYAVGVPLLFLLMLWARLSAWQKHLDDAPVFAQPGTAEKTGPDMAMDTLARAKWASNAVGASLVVPRDDVDTISAEGRAWLRREGGKKHFFLQLLWVLGIYAIGGFALFFAVPTFVSLWAILVKIGSIRWWLPAALILLVVGGFWLFYALRALHIRRKFLKNLRALCAEHGFTVEEMKRPYFSLFRYRDGINFILSANGKRYACKFFGSMRRHWDMYFHESGTLKIRRALRFRRVEFLCFTSEYSFAFESDLEKICIVAPVPKVISAGNDRWNRPIDTGTKVGDYRIFSSTGFLNALARDCVERDE